MTTAREEGTYKPLPKVPAAYKLTDEESGAVYIGSTGNLRARVTDHRSKVARGNHPNLNFREQITSWDSIAIEYIPCKDYPTARRIEDSLMEFHDGDNLLNVAVGDNHTPFREGRVYRSSHYDTIIPLGKTEEAKQLLSDKLKGQKRSEETRKRMSEGAKRRGNNFTEEGIAKARATRSQPVVVGGVSYDSSRAAGRAHGVCEHTAKNRAKSSKFENWSFGPKEN